MKSYIFALAFILTAACAFAQDPPSRVARLNWMDGNVSFQPASVDTWTAATLNYPLTTGDHIYTDSGARAEMHVGANALRLNGQTNFGFLNLDDQTVQVRFTEGSMEVRLRRLEDADLYEVDTPQGAISLLRTGDYRIDSDPARNATMITVITGEVEVTANGNSFAVHPRQTAYFAADAAPDVRPANPPDDFDQFAAAQNAREERSPPPVHVPPTMIGYQDLDANGVWRNEPGYGWVWIPRVPVGWAPYHNGHWAWVEPWGWTWIDDAPWGFAPFHYGRWAFVAGTWVWIPGSMVGRPVYAPALVAFVGGPRFGVSIGFGVGIGAVAWFPLGPREPFFPAYHVSPAYVQQVNITHVTNINVVNVTNVRYVNQQVPGAVVAVPQASFAGARPVAAEARVVNAQQMAEARVVGTAPQVAPVRESVLANSRANAVVPHPSQAIMSRPIVTKSTPPPAPVSFQAKQQMLQQNSGRPLDPQQITQARAQQPAAAAPAPQPGRLDSRPPSAQRPAFSNAPAPAPAPQAARPLTPENRPAPAAAPAARLQQQKTEAHAKAKSKRDTKEEKK